MELTDTNLAWHEPALLSSPAPAPALLATTEHVPLDPTVLNALSNARDRFLLLRAEQEMERFLADTTMTRLPLTPPYFPPQLNSYQRLLIHRLSETFGFIRQVESPQNYQNLPLNLPTVIIIVKGPNIRLPPVKLAVLVPAPTAPATKATTPPIDSTTPSPPATEASTQPTPPPVPQFFKILPRSSHPSSSSASSSVADDDGKGKGRKEMTLEERETAYREARERIFVRENPTPDQVALGANLPRPNSAGSTYSRSSLAQSISSHRISPSVTSSSSHVSSPAPFQHNSTVYYTHTSNGSHATTEGFHRGNLRPSAPSFDPGAQSWSAYSYASTSYQNGEYVAQSAYGEGPGMPYPFPPHGANPYLQQQQVEGGYDPRFGGGHPGYSQPPIQIIAASPLPQHAVYPPSFPTPYPPSFVPPPQQQPHYLPSPSAPFVPPQWPRQAPLASPALSASSTGSYAPSSVVSSHVSPDRAGGYIMRFAEGGLAYGSLSGPPSRSTGSTGSASTSRTASSSNLRNSSSGYGGGGSSGPVSAASIGTGMGDYERGGAGGMRRTAAGTGLSSPAQSSVGGGRAMSSSSGSVGNTKRSASASGSSAAGSDSGRARNAPPSLTSSSAASVSTSISREGAGDAKGKGRQKEEVEGPERLHPSLPAKPVWAAVLPAPTSMHTHTNGAGAGGGGAGGGGKQYPPSVAGVGTTFYPIPPSSNHPHPPPYSSYAPQQQDFTSYPPLSQIPSQTQAPGSTFAVPSSISTTYDRNTGGAEELRRPTPRSTALFDPNSAPAKVAVEEKTVGGTEGQEGKQVEGLAKEVDFLHLQ